MLNRKRPCWLLLALAGMCCASASAADPAQIKGDESTLTRAGVGTDGEALLEFFRKRVAKEDEEDRIAKFVGQLGDRKFTVREDATEQLFKIGPPALAQLEQVLKNSNDPEVKRRAEDLVEDIRKLLTTDLVGAAVRLLAVRNPDGSAEMLLAYLPSTSDNYLVDEIRAALHTVALRKGKLDPVLLKGLEDKIDDRRAAAAEVVARLGDADQRKEARKLLTDKSSLVRQRVAVGLLDHQDREAVAVLIKLLTEVERKEVWAVEEVLLHIAGEKAPRASLGKTEDDRKKYAKTWADWWAREGGKLTLPKMDPGSRVLGYTLLCIQEPRVGVGGLPTGKVVELDPSGKPRWTVDKLNYPQDAVMLTNNRVAVLEQNRTISVKTTTGEEVWKKDLANTFYGIQRLKNGNVFVYGRMQAVELDPQGKEVSTINFNRGARNYVYAASKAPNGDIVVLERNLANRTADIVRMDDTGKELKRFSLQLQTVTTVARIEALANGNVLVPTYTGNKVLELDSEGKTVMEITSERPTFAQRLPNGRTVIGSRYNRVLLEVDRQGKEVSRMTLDQAQQIIQARRR